MAEERKYRELHRGRNLTYFNVKVEQTDLDIGARTMLREEALAWVKRYRGDIEEYIRKHPQFLTSLAPVSCSLEAPAIVKRMCQAAEQAGVGPMAAVAGAMSQFVGEALLKLTPEVIVENGGDLYLKSEQDRTVGIYAGQSPLNDKLGLKVKSADTPLGICTSAGKIGHSLSYGRADAVVVLSRDAVLADAAATAVGNIVGRVEDISKAVNYAKRIDGVKGVLVIMEDKMGVWGDVELIRL